MNAIGSILRRIGVEPDPSDEEIAAAKASALRSRRNVERRIVARFLDRDDVIDGLTDWLANVYDDGMPPTNDLLAMLRRLADDPA